MKQHSLEICPNKGDSAWVIIDATDGPEAFWVNDDGAEITFDEGGHIVELRTGIVDYPQPSISSLASRFLNEHDPDAFFRDPTYDGPCQAIDPNKVDDLALHLLEFIADVVATVIDAGSERDAVNENDELYAALRTELRGWTAQEAD